jgi:NAD(P)H-dependent FMN reductase
MSGEPHVVVMSGSLAVDSRTERLARWCASECGRRRARATLFRGVDLDFPFYRPGMTHVAGPARLLRELACADGVVLISPSYHGTLTGLLKNALDYANDLAADDQRYLDGRPVGCVAVAAGEQGAASTLSTLRIVAHALRGWPTPLGVAISTEHVPIAHTGEPEADRCRFQLETMIGQVLSMASWHATERAATGASGHGDPEERGDPGLDTEFAAVRSPGQG